MNIVRVIFGLILAGAGVAATLTQPGLVMWIALGVGAALLLLTVLIEARVRQGDPRQVATGALGLAAGFGFAALVTLVATTLPATAALLAGHAAATGFGVVVLFLLLGYLGAAAGQAVTYELTLFRQPELDGGAKARFLVGEKSLIDGRIIKLAESPLLTGEVIVPRFVVDQLNQLAAAHVAMDRFRGERGLDSLRRLQQNRARAVFIREIDLLHGEIEGVLDYAVQHDARIVTQNPEMIKEAGRRGIPIVNLNDIAAMLVPEVLSGDEIVVRLVKTGKEKEQAVGYLENGNMVVVENGRADIGRTVRVAVSGIHQTRAGTLIFAKKRGDTGESVEPSPGALEAMAVDLAEGVGRP